MNRMDLLEIANTLNLRAYVPHPKDLPEQLQKLLDEIIIKFLGKIKDDIDPNDLDLDELGNLTIRLSWTPDTFYNFFEDQYDDADARIPGLHFDKNTDRWVVSKNVSADGSLIDKTVSDIMIYRT